MFVHRLYSRLKDASIISEEAGNASKTIYKWAVSPTFGRVSSNCL